MTPPIEVTSDHMARAYAQMRRHNTPALDLLREHWSLYSCIRGRALGIAQGHTLPPEPTVAADAATTAAPGQHSAAPSPERRRTALATHHTTAAYDCKRAAAGDIDDKD